MQYSDEKAIDLREAKQLWTKLSGILDNKSAEIVNRSRQLNALQETVEKERSELQAKADAALAAEREKLTDELNKERDAFLTEKKDFEAMQAKLLEKYQDTSNVCVVDVGGQVFKTLRSTLCKHKGSLLAGMFSGLFPVTRTPEGHAFIDRNPKYFQMILEFLRTDELEVDHLSAVEQAALAREMDYFGFAPPESLTFLSKVINAQQKETIIQWLPSHLKQAQWTLLFRASEHQFRAATFHQMCDGKSNTVVVVKATGNVSICGGYVDVAWHSSGSYVQSSGAFLFSLVNTAGIAPQMFRCTNTTNGIYTGQNYGPTFGGGHDLYLVDNCNVTTGSYSNMPHSYTGPNASNTILMGSYNGWLVEEYEVWQLA